MNLITYKFVNVGKIIRKRRENKLFVFNLLISLNRS